MEPEALAEFLQQHPDFFEQHPEVLDSLRLPHPHAEGTISLAERQLLNLREKTQQLELKLAELIHFGEENDELGEKVHGYAVDLLLAPTYSALLATAFGNLRERFAVPYVALRLWDLAVGDGETFEAVSDATRAFAADLTHPYCGIPTSQEISAWFGAEIAPHLRSVCLVALRGEAERVFGLLALGSGEAERFYPEMGTLYVERIGELLAAALRRQLA